MRKDAEPPYAGRMRGMAAAVASGWRGWVPAIAAPPIVWPDIVEQELAARRLFNWLPVAFGLGALLYFSAGAEPAPWAAPLFAVLAGAGAVATWGSWIGRVCLAVVFMFLGFIAADIRVARLEAPALSRTLIAITSGKVVTVDRRADGARVVLDVHAIAGLAPETMPARIRVNVRGTFDASAGDWVTGRMRLTPPPGPAAPGGYDFARDAWFRGIGAVGTALDPPRRMAPLRNATPLEQLRSAIDRARNDLTARIATSIGGQAGAVAAALVTGKRDLIDESTNEILRGAGIYHVVSISGLHMVLAAGIFFWSLRAGLALCPALALRLPAKKWAAAGSMLGACAYCVFSGAEVATQRSLVMSLVMMGAIIVDRPAISLRNLAISALIVLALTPEAILGPSFQMSFAAVAAMIATHGWAIRPVRAHPTTIMPPSAWLWRVARGAGLSALVLLTTTLVAGLATAPFAAFHFHRVNPFGLLGNALALPVVSLVVMPAAVAGALTYPLGLDGPVWRAMGFGVDLMNAAAAWVAGIPGSSQPTAAFGTGALLCFSAALLLFTLWKTLWLRALAAPMLIAGLTLAASDPRPDILIDRDRRAAAIRTADGHLAVVGRSAPRFIVSRWLSADGDGRASTDASLRTGRCDRQGCVARLADGRAIAISLDPAGLADDCRRAAIVVTSLTVPHGCRTATIIDRGMPTETGALALFAQPGGGFRIETSRPPQTGRPWLGGPAAPRSSDAGIAPARRAPPGTTSRGAAPAATPFTADTTDMEDSDDTAPPLN